MNRADARAGKIDGNGQVAFVAQVAKCAYIGKHYRVAGFVTKLATPCVARHITWAHVFATTDSETSSK